MPALSPGRSEKIPVTRLLRHVTEATSHAEQLGVSPAVSVGMLNAIAFELLHTGQLDSTRPLLDSALRIAHAHLGPDHPDTLRTRNNLASWLGEAGRAQDAITLFPAATH
jgi:hypothetical protein